MLTPQQALKSLKALGWTQVRIARRLNSTQGHISAILNGHNPKYDLAVRLIALANRESKKQEKARA